MCSWRGIHLATIVGVVVAALPNLANGQSSSAIRAQLRDKTPVVLLILNRSEEFRDVTVVRRASMSPNDVIVIPRAQLDADLVSRAVYHLQLSRKANGLKPARDEKHRVGPADRVSNNPYAEEAEMWVRLIDQSDPTNVPGFGLVRAMTVFLPNNDRAIASSR